MMATKLTTIRRPARAEPANQAGDRAGRLLSPTTQRSVQETGVATPVSSISPRLAFLLPTLLSLAPAVACGVPRSPSPDDRPPAAPRLRAYDLAPTHASEVLGVLKSRCSIGARSCRAPARWRSPPPASSWSPPPQNSMLA